MPSTYQIIDEIEPVTNRSFAFHPSLPLLAAMFFPTSWLVGLTSVNSFLLGHPRRYRHAQLGLGLWALTAGIIAITLHYIPRPAWPYISILINAIDFSYAYHISDEQTRAAEMFEEAGGTVVGVGRTFQLVMVINRIRSILRPRK